MKNMHFQQVVLENWIKTGTTSPSLIRTKINLKWSPEPWFMPVTLATREAEIGRIVV
jgi:hypothetical protein